MALIDTLGVRRPRSLSVKKPSLMARLALWRSRRTLAHLDARALKDVGISPDAARREAQLGLWDVPPSWTQR